MKRTSTMTIHLRSGRQVAFDVDEGLNSSPLFVLGVVKSGSSLLNMLCSDLARVNRCRFVDVGGVFFDANIPAADWSADVGWLPIVRPGNMYGGFRAMPRALEDQQIFQASPKVLMVRDPRDAL